MTSTPFSAVISDQLKSGALIEVSAPRARELFPNWAIYFEQDGALVFRCWWDEVCGRPNQFPEGRPAYFVSPRAQCSEPLMETL